MRNILEYLENSAEKYGSKTAAKDDKTLTVGGSCGCIGECNKNLRETCGFKCLYDISVDMIMEKVDIMVRQLQGQTYEGTMKNEKN